MIVDVARSVWREKAVKNSLNMNIYMATINQLVELLFVSRATGHAPRATAF